MTMKRILAAAFLSVMALQAGAQGWTDALNFSENDYLGTARSVGMGNAMTAVGGDLGSLTFNPAGSRVPCRMASKTSTRTASAGWACPTSVR